MREIKFKVWDRVGKRWLDDSIKLRINGKALIDEDGWAYKINERFDIVQYTGLKDKNYKEIYEGDILNVDGEIREVGWDRDEALFTTYTGSGKYLELYLTERPLIIGNIYEHPELLQTEASRIIANGGEMKNETKKLKRYKVYLEYHLIERIEVEATSEEEAMIEAKNQVDYLTINSSLYDSHVTEIK